MMHSLCSVVVSHGGSSHLYELLTSLLSIKGGRVVLVENGPLDQTAVPDGVRIVEGQGNVGYGTAVNIAVRHVLAEAAGAGERLEAGEGLGARPAGSAGDGAPEWVLVVNSDVTIPARTAAVLPELLAWYPPSVDAVGFPFLDTPDGPPGRSRAVLPTPRTNAFTTVRGEVAAVARWPHLRYPVGAFFAIRTQTFLELGGFDPSFWMYYEETDLFARLYASGGRIAWADDEWPVVHVGGETVGRSPMLHTELGRAAAVYARRHRVTIGRSWPAVHAAQLGLLTARKIATGRPHDARRAARMLVGLLGGLARPSWEPAVTSRWQAIPAETRLRLGHLPRPHHQPDEQPDEAGLEAAISPVPAVVTPPPRSIPAIPAPARVTDPIRGAGPDLEALLRRTPRG
ncbi:glycosyltransferase family 2 protein [Candidatus Frankia nodulisporulans]|uniref:glycosyltransferase family 2 protein n=1 Tax=Candidatus Frankia nodulisporulans TaxID=2060052 RepID=UPI00370458C5